MAIPILAYHNISNKMEVGFTRNTVHQFRKQMDWLFRNGFQTITLQDYYNYLEIKNSGIRDNLIILTFDDAYDSLAYVARIMDEFGFIGCTFAISNYVGQQNTWDYQFFNRKINHANYGSLHRLIEKGWEVGSHTKTHPFLPALTRNQILDEISQSKIVLEERLGNKVQSISYPYGKCTPKICCIAKDVGYHVGVSLGMGQTQKVDLMNLHRIGIYLFDVIPVFSRKIKQITQESSNMFALQRCISSFSYGSIFYNKLKNKFIN